MNGRRAIGAISRLRPARIDRGPCVRLRQRQEGQALVEFALIAPLFLMIVFGIIYFGIGLNQWLDMNRVANQGSRQAVVNHWPPYCPRKEPDGDPTPSCTNSTSTTACSTVLTTNSRARLQDVMRCQTRNNATVTVCYPGKAPPAKGTIGEPVRVKVSAPYSFFFMQSLDITLTATAAMRLEQVPTLITSEVACA